MEVGDSRYYEGCGHEGPIRCIFLCEFHPTAGPRITYQVPDDYVSKEIFDAVSVYIIPKPQLQRTILTVNVLGFKITGFPVKIDNAKYARNAYYFNICFVCDSWARTVQYEAVIKKFSEYLITMEEQTGFLSDANQPESENSKLPAMLKQILEDLNSKKQCSVTDGNMTMHLKVVKMSADPQLVVDHVVPILLIDLSTYNNQQWDLTTQRVLQHIDGFNHVAKIAAQADVENSLVKACIQNLLYYGVISLLPIFQYSNVYAATPELRTLTEKKSLQEECLQFVSKSCGTLPSLRDVFVFYCSMTYGTTLKDLCVRFNPSILHIDEKKLIQFGLRHKLIRRIHKYPVWVDNNSQCSVPSPMKHVFTGMASYDELCCDMELTYQQLDKLVEHDPRVLIVWK